MCKTPASGDMFDSIEQRTDPLPLSLTAAKERIAQLEQELAEAKADKLKIQRDLLLVPTIHSRMKAGCIGEFKILTQQVCPECWGRAWNLTNDDCEICSGESDENGLYDVEVDVPWNTQKQIFKRMCHFKFEAIKNGDEQ